MKFLALSAVIFAVACVEAKRWSSDCDYFWFKPTADTVATGAECVTDFTTNNSSLTLQQFGHPIKIDLADAGFAVTKIEQLKMKVL